MRHASAWDTIPRSWRPSPALRLRLLPLPFFLYSASERGWKTIITSCRSKQAISNGFSSRCIVCMGTYRASLRLSVFNLPVFELLLLVYLFVCTVCTHPHP